jgi:hypothetical protein
MRVMAELFFPAAAGRASLDEPPERDARFNPRGSRAQRQRKRISKTSCGPSADMIVGHPRAARADASSSRLAIRPRPLRDFATGYSAAALTADPAARAEAGASTSHRISFKSSTKMENNTGTSSSVTNVASVSPPICA